MHICQIMAGQGNGGLEKHTIELSSALQKRGINVTVIAHPEFEIQLDNVRFIPLDLTKGRNNIFLLFKLYKILKKEKFDIIHTQANKATDMITKLKPFLKANIVSTLHNYKKNLNSFMKSDAVITVSDKIGEKLNTEKKVTVYNGIHIEKEGKIDLYSKFNIPQNKFIICSVGRLVKAKGFDLLIKSMRYMDKNIDLLLIGDGPEKGKLENLVKQLNLKDRVYFLGNVENKVTKCIIRSCDLLVIPSRREGFSYVFAESLLLETPIISTDVADIKKFITSKFIVSFDSESLANKINDFRKNYDDNILEYDAIFNKAKSVFPIENMIKNTIEVYKKVMS